MFKNWKAPVRLQVAHIQSSWTLVSSHKEDPHSCWSIVLCYCNDQYSVYPIRIHEKVYLSESANSYCPWLGSLVPCHAKAAEKNVNVLPFGLQCNQWSPRAGTGVGQLELEGKLGEAVSWVTYPREFTSWAPCIHLCFPSYSFSKIPHLIWPNRQVYNCEALSPLCGKQHRSWQMVYGESQCHGASCDHRAHSL